ncbi:cysteine peptidase family C39 domain-containing protein [Mucisphaera calidilacus]|uniref:Peptidase C39 domain-containing protein n=1 Tax=Mucisphaera calidilacus TaxID=2527982 RepID=A0A518BWJ9_9BACT|nr:cysteine peptidase family C39 domain-containing protein [Mucisphaera calidilacus]QDU71347.1 hypothetical protein Pan265_11960 [Mucisphaera calidilacus]
MDGSSVWFLAILILSVATWFLGVQIARKRPDISDALIIGGLVGLGVWAWLMHRPDVGTQLIPTRVLAYLEGVGSVPLFMLLVGAAFGRSRSTREGGFTAMAGMLGMVYLFYGGWWMLQSTPAHAFGGQSRTPAVMQTHDYSCVAASCTTTLRLVGIQTSEAEMAELTMTRPGSGSTLIRAAHAMSRKMGDQAEVAIVEMPYEHLDTMPMPAMTPLRFESSRYHMVTLLRVGDRGVWLLDPVDGLVYMAEPTFRGVYQRRLLILGPASPTMLARADAKIDRLLRMVHALRRDTLAQKTGT